MLLPSPGRESLRSREYFQAYGIIRKLTKGLKLVRNGLQNTELKGSRV